jgi:hypothetical protein
MKQYGYASPTVLEETEESKKTPNFYRNQMFHTTDGDTTYSRRNYNTNLYTHKQMVGVGYRSLVLRDFLINTAVSKIKCLTVAGKDAETPMLAIQKDAEYFPTFKDCMKE